MGLPLTQTVITHQEIRGVTVSVLDGPPLDRRPGEPEDDDLYEINMDFVGDLLKDDGEETIATWSKRITLSLVCLRGLKIPIFPP